PTQPRNWVINFWDLDAKWIFVAVPFGFLTMLLFYYDHVYLLHSSDRSIDPDDKTECEQLDSPSQTVPSEEARRFPLGFLPPWMHYICCGYFGPSNAQWTCASGTHPPCLSRTCHLMTTGPCSHR